MSLLWTESFAGFRKGSVTTQDDLRAADYLVEATDADWEVIDDLIVPNRLVLTSHIQAEGGSVTLGRALPTYTAPVIIGFSLYVPLNYERPTNDSAALLTIRTRQSGDGVGSEVARVRNDLQIGYQEGTPQSSAVMTPGRVHYVEVRISLGEVRAWLDDVFVLQHTTVDASPLEWSLELAQGDFTIGNLYVLNEDATYPNVRLGRATRVVGERPSADITATFERPVNAETNAAVISQDFLAEPRAVLQGSNVGDEDLYAVEGDGAASASKIHALSLKVRASNADVVSRAVAPFVEHGGQTDTGVTHARYHYLEPFTDDDITCSAVVPGYGVCVGTATGQIWFSEDGEQFDGMAESTGAAITDMVVKSNALIATCADGKVIRGNFSVTPSSWVTIDTPATGALRAIATSDTRLIAVGDGGRVIVSPTGEADTWASRSVGHTEDLTAVTFSGDHWLTAASFAGTSLRVSLNDGDTWMPTSAAKPAVASPLKMRTLNGRTVVMGGSATPIASRLALLGFDTPFYAATKLGNLPTVPRCVDGTFIAGVYLFALEDGTTLVSEDAIVCQLGEKLDMEILTVAHLDSGRVLLAGKGGQMYLRASMPAATELPVLSGFVNGFATVIRDPATNLEWAPQAAAEANIGVRIVDYPAYGDTGDYLLTEKGLRILDEHGRKILLEDFTK